MGGSFNYLKDFGLEWCNVGLISATDWRHVTNKIWEMHLNPKKQIWLFPPGPGTAGANYFQLIVSSGKVIDLQGWDRYSALIILFSLPKEIIRTIINHPGKWFNQIALITLSRNRFNSINIFERIYEREKKKIFNFGLDGWRNWL